MTRFRIQEVTTFYDEYEVEAESKEQAVAIHRAQGSWMVPPLTFSECEIFDVIEATSSGSSGCGRGSGASTSVSSSG